MCENDRSTTISEFESQYTIFSTKQNPNNSSMTSYAKDTGDELMDIIKKRGKKGFGASSARFLSETQNKPYPGPGTYRQEVEVIRSCTKHGFGVGKRQIFQNSNNKCKTAYYGQDQQLKPVNKIRKTHQKHSETLFSRFRKKTNMEENNQTPGPGYYTIHEKMNGPSYRNLFKSNISQSQTIERESLPPIQQIPKREVKNKQKGISKMKKIQTRKYYCQATQKYLTDVQNQNPKLLNQDLVFLTKNTNAFIQKNVKLYSSYIPVDSNPAPNAYKVKLPNNKLIGFKFSKAQNKENKENSKVGYSHLRAKI